MLPAVSYGLREDVPVSSFRAGRGCATSKTGVSQASAACEPPSELIDVQGASRGERRKRQKPRSASSLEQECAQSRVSDVSCNPGSLERAASLGLAESPGPQVSAVCASVRVWEGLEASEGVWEGLERVAEASEPVSDVSDSCRTCV